MPEPIPPQDAAALCRLAQLDAEQNKLDAAAARYRKALEIEPGHAEARSGLARLAAAYRARGAALRKRGETDQALAAYRAAVTLDPAEARSYVEIGSIHFDRGQNEQALAYWRKAADLKPGDSSAVHNAGAALRNLRRRDEAIAMFRKAIALDPGRPHGYASLGGLYKDARRFEDAVRVYEELLAAIPGSPEGIAGLAAVHEAEGRLQEAYDLVRPLIDGGATHAGLWGTYALVCHRLAEPPAEAVGRLEKYLETAKLPPQERRRILIGLGNLCDVLHRPAEAFAHFQQVHHLEPDLPDIRKGNVANVQRQARIYSAQRLAQLPRAQNGSELPLFILGMPRSGTTLTEQILSSHPRVFGAGELTHIGKLSTSQLGTGVPFPECLAVLTREDVERLSQEYLDELRKLSPDAARVTDKMPLNFLHLGLIELLFPRARVVHCVRHPLDTCLSIYFNEFTDALAFTRDLETLGAYYREYWRLMRHWKRVLRVPLLELRYEEMVAQPEAMSRRLVDFAGLEWDEACLRFHETRRTVATPSYHQVRKPVYTRSVARYQAYERFLGPLKDALGDLSAYGY